MSEMVALSKKWYKDKVVELQAENKKLIQYKDYVESRIAENYCLKPTRNGTR